MRARLAGGAALAVLTTLAASTTHAPRAQDGPGGISSMAIADDGEAIYRQVCQACHMADARGGGGAGAGIPALADNPRLESKDYAITILVNGRGGMPWFTDVLSAEQMAAVLTHVRTRFNNYPDPVTTAEVERIAGPAGASSGLE